MGDFGGLWREMQRFLEASGIEPAPHEALDILENITGMDRLALLHGDSTQPMGIIADNGWRLATMRATGLPLAHVLGGTWFAGRWWEVGPEVLIPRPDSETLVQVALAMLQTQDAPAPSIMEVGVGSGAILGTLALDLPANIQANDCQFFGSDLDPQVIARAAGNFARHRIEGAILAAGDLLAPFANTTFDLIMSNPPYIGDGEWATLDASVRVHEPRLALTGSLPNPDGLRVYKALVPQAVRQLRAGGAIILEIGWQQAAAVQELLQEPTWNNIQIHKDLAGRDRVIAARRSSVL